MRKAMSKLLSVAVLVCTAMIASYAQQNSLHKTDIDALLVQLRSNDGGRRDTAFYQLRSNQVAMRSAKVRSALLSLLDQENHEAEAGMHMGEGEGYGEYFSDLLGTVESFADWNDPRQVCILVNAGAIPDSPVPAETAAHMKMAIPCLLEMSKGANRVTAIPVLIQALATAKDDLDSGTIQTAKHVISLALHDSDEGVRFFAVDALTKFSGEDMIPALKEVAANDPSPEIQGRSIRKSATDAIAAIQKRAGRN